MKRDNSDRQSQKKVDEPGLAPAVPGVDAPLTKEERSLDIGGSGQFAPGGYYNQQAVTKPDRIDLDEDIALRRHS